MRCSSTIRAVLCLWFCLTLRASAQPNVTPYTRMTAQLKADAARCPLLRVASLGQSAKGRRDLWLVRLADPRADPAQTIRVLVLCRQHGDEPASTESVLGLIRRIAEGGDPALRASLAHVTLYLIPMVNPDGAEADTRNNGVGADLNRDWGIFHQPETRAVARAAHLLRPSLVLDAHNWDGDDEYNADCLEVPREAATGRGKASHAFQQQAVRDLAACGYPVHPTAWGADTDPRLAHRWFARRNILSALVETHSGSPADTPDFQRRQGLYAALIHGLVRRYAASYATEKPQLDALEGDTMGDVHDAALFPPSPQAATRPFLSLPHGRSCAWLWAIGAYALALWWAQRTHPAASGFPSRPCLQGLGSRYNGKGRSKHGKGFGAVPASHQEARAFRSLVLCPLLLREGKPLAAGWVPKTGYYSLARKRDGTDTTVRSRHGRR